MSRAHHRIIELTSQQCRDRLETHRPRLGRVAFAEGGDPQWPAVLPVNYAYRDGRIYFRTFEGSKLYAALRRQRVAFEVDVVDGAWQEGWSVMALGTLEPVRDPAQRLAVDDLLRSWVADRTEQLVGLEIERLTGREIIGSRPDAPDGRRARMR